MHSSFVRHICRVLVACMVGLPFQAQAGLIGTDQAVSAAHAQVARATLAGFINRGEAAGELQALGLSSQAAKERVAALTDAEAATLAGRIESLPAGAGGQAIGFLLVALFLLWRFAFSDQAKAETAKPTPKPAPKPAPEKK
ncbi:MAG: PA2779 family protein [Pseudomonadota bacterium]